MKILLSFLQDSTLTPHPVPAYRFWSYYIKNGINEAGMSYLEVPGADWAEGLLYSNKTAENNTWKDINWSLTINFIKKNRDKIDVFLCYLFPQQIDVSALKEIKELGIPCVNFYCDNVREFTKVPPEFKAFDLIWVPEFEALHMYKKSGLKFIHCPMPMWVDKKFRHVNDTAEIVQLSFIGSKDVLRTQLLYQLVNKELPITIRGSGWDDIESLLITKVTKTRSSMLQNQIDFIADRGIKSWFIKTLQTLQRTKQSNISTEFIKPKPNFDEYVTITRNSSITLGINRVPSYKRLNSNPLIYSRLRDIEAPMLGACYLTEHCDGVEQLYDLDNEIWTYKNADDLYVKAFELLNDPKKRHQLKLNGQRKALQEHSIPKTLTKIKSALFS